MLSLKNSIRSSTSGESAEQYITCLYSLIETCEYGTFKEEMLRDRLVVGIRDAAMSQKLQMDAELTLEKVTKSLRQKEAVMNNSVSCKETAAQKTPLSSMRSDIPVGEVKDKGRF